MHWYDKVLTLPSPQESLLAWDKEEHIRCVAIARCLQEVGYPRRRMQEEERAYYDLLNIELNWRVGMGRAMRPFINEIKENRQ